MWSWQDEGDLWGTKAHTLRSWTYRSHELDSQHLVLASFMGITYRSNANFRELERQPFTYYQNARAFGRRTPVADMLAIDYYPVDAGPGIGRPGNGTFEILISALENLRTENYDLIPFISVVETANATADTITPWPPSPEQLKMLTWISVVHEVKGMAWFQYFGATPQANYDAMAEFTTRITELAAVVLGPKSTRVVNISYDVTGEVHTLVKDYNGAIYLFAVRISDLIYDTVSGSPMPEQNYTINATFDFQESIDASAVALYEYDGVNPRLLNVSNGIFSDTFAPYEVHIYRIGDVLPGDINGDGNVGLTDAIIALIITAQADHTGINVIKAAAVSNQKIGMKEAIYALRKAAKL